MKIGVIGISHKTSDLQLREWVARACQRCFGGESPEAARLSSVLLSTCNRTEIYFSVTDLAEAHTDLMQAIREEVGSAFEHKLYAYFGEECFAHLAMVTSGLDSVVLAETEIQRQVKSAYENACIYHSLHSSIHFLFQKCLKIGKWIRSTFPFPMGKSSLEGMIYHLLRLTFPKSQDLAVLFIGNSEINRKIITYFKLKAAGALTLCTRAPHSAQEFAQGFNLRLTNWDELPHWSKYNLVICGTNQHDYLIAPEQLKKSFSTRMIIDLSMPRNVDPRLGLNPQINLLNIDQLGSLIEKKKEAHLGEIAASQEIIRQAVERQIAIYHNKQKKAEVCA